MRFLKGLFLLLFVCSPAQVCGQSGQYDIAYLWDATLNNVLDYQTQLEELLGPQNAKHLRIVGRKQGGFGLVYDHNGTALSSAHLMIEQSEILRNAGLAECFAVEDHGYYELYNVSYGLGPNLDSLKKRYRKVYQYLGAEVKKDLFIEQTDRDNYNLIYRRRGDRSSTYAIAKRHAKLLKHAKISTTIIAEHNNPVVFGESSHLDNIATPAQKEIVVLKQPEKIAVTPASVKSKKTSTVTTRLASSSTRESGVERTIEAYIKGLRRKGKLSSDEKTGWAVYDLSSGESLVDINVDQVFQAASMIKPFVALAFFHRVQKGELVYGPQSRRKMELMIQHSNNSATNWVMRAAGGPAQCNAVLRTHYSNIFKNTAIVEYIPAGGRTYKNSAQPSDYIRFLQALWSNQLPYGKEIRRLMSLPGRDRLYDGTPIPQGTLVYNKTGTTAHLCGDMGILVPLDKMGNRHPYALVGIIEKSSRPNNYGNWMLTRGNVIREVSTLVYQEMKKQYKLL